MKSPRYRHLTEDERAQAVIDLILDAPLDASAAPKKRLRRKREQDAEVFTLATWRLPEKYRKSLTLPNGLDVSDAAMGKMLRGCERKAA